MLNYKGLRQKKSYDDLVNYINVDQEIMKYPNRKATFIANSPEVGMLLEFDELDEQDKNIKLANAQQLLRTPLATPLRTPLGTPSQHASGATTPVQFGSPGATQPAATFYDSTYGFVPTLPQFGEQLDAHVDLGPVGNLLACSLCLVLSSFILLQSFLHIARGVQVVILVQSLVRFLYVKPNLQ